jgi:hypothetical protein
MKNKFISNSRRIFLVKFNNSTEIFIVQDRQLFELIKENDGVIEFIKMSESYNVKFVRCSRAVILRQFNWDTEVIQYFKTLSYFKGVKYL